MADNEYILGVDADVTKVAISVIEYETGILVDSISINRNGKGWNFSSLMEMFSKVKNFVYSSVLVGGWCKPAIKMVAIEDYGPGWVYRTANYKGEVLGLLKFFFAQEGIPILLSGSKKKKKKKIYVTKLMVSPSRVKKFFYGKGNAKKGKSNKGFLIAFKRFGLEFENDDLLDSFIIAELCRDVLLFEESKQHLIKRKLNAKELEVINDFVKDRNMEINGKIVREEIM